jgi:hypothetical protein
MSKIAKKMKKAPRILPARILMNRASQARSTTPWTRPYLPVIFSSSPPKPADSKALAEVVEFGAL